MLDIEYVNGQPTLSINGAIIGTEKEILNHLRKSEGYDELVELIHEENTNFNDGVTNE